MDAENLFSCIDSLPSEHQKWISHWGRGPRVPVPHSTVHGAFESIADIHPLVVAARHEERSITYRELDVRANRLANHLIELGLRPRQRVCLVVHRSLEMLIGIFAILKAGCQYVPIDGGVASKEAMPHILSDTEAHFILCLERFQDLVNCFRGGDTTLVLLGKDVDAFCSTERARIEVASGDGVYAIYTSGSLKLGAWIWHCAHNTQEVLAVQKA